jgi:microcin C transport system ATP-binding protein
VENVLLSVNDLSIRFRGQQLPATDKVGFVIQPGERLAIVGESGSGKSVTALSILGLIKQAEITGEVFYNGKDLLKTTEQELQTIRGKDIAMIFQEPMTALNPLHTIGNQIIESLLRHTDLDKASARHKAIELLGRTGIRESALQVDRYPHQLSGGQRQRAMIAMALACGPKLLIADEPTTALDSTIRAKIIELLLDLQREFGMAILLITHDLNLVKRFAERVIVMRRGKVVEAAKTTALFDAPTHPYTIKLINSLPERLIRDDVVHSSSILNVKNITVEYTGSGSGFLGWFAKKKKRVLHDVNISLSAGETIGVVGESGSGKSTLAQAILKLIPIQSGELNFFYRDAPRSSHDNRHHSTRHGDLAFRRRVQIVFQDPYGSLSPRRTIGQIIGEGLELHYPELSKEIRQSRVIDALTDVGLPTHILRRYPHEFSGGQRQRIAIARALVVCPEILILDEPTSALDVSIQKQVLDLLVALQRKYSLSYLLISHDLAVIRALSHRVYVMKDGRIVEHGDSEEVITNPENIYTKTLVQAFQ